MGALTSLRLLDVAGNKLKQVGKKGKDGWGGWVEEGCVLCERGGAVPLKRTTAQPGFTCLQFCT